VNEYTRREEVRWTLIASLAMVLCIAPAVVLLVTAKGKLIQDPAAKTAAEDAANRVKPAHVCVVAAEKLDTELTVFKESAKTAKITADEPVDDSQTISAKKKKKPTITRQIKDKVADLDKGPDVSVAWGPAQSVEKAAKALAPCRTNVEAAAGVHTTANPVWDAIAAAAAVPASTDDKNEQIKATRTLLKTFGELSIDKVIEQSKDAETKTQEASDKAQQEADTKKVFEPIPEGLIPRRLAVGIGVGLSVIALLLSYLSVRVASNKRLATLVPLREAAKTNQPGIHAAAVLRLAAQGNGGLPGGVVGGALGGLIAAYVQPIDTDVFIGGVMSGFLLGLLVQFLYRMALGASKWRARVTELADIEKPAIPIVLVLSGVNQGLEAPFIKFFTGLSPADAASTVEKLAAQAEERILAAADAGAAARGAPGAPGFPGAPQ
jgi:hypothetical protein